MSVTLERVLVRNVKDMWVHDADWDQYFLRIGARGGAIGVRAIALVDATQTPVHASADRNELVEGSRAAEKRYQSSGSLVRSKDGAWAFAGGVATTGTGVAMASALMPYAFFAPGVLLLAAPALIGGAIAGSVGLNRMVDNAHVADEIKRRASVLPVTLGPGREEMITLFYPVTPLPSRIEIHYAHDGGDSHVAMDIREALAKAHLEPAPWVVSRSEPMFPIAAMRAGILQGRVKARLTVNPNGSVAGVTILESEPPGRFDREAIATFKMWRYNMTNYTRDLREAEETMVLGR